MQFIRLNGPDFYESIIQPQFSDVSPDARSFNGVLNEFTVMDNVNRRKPIIGFKRVQNIMQRRDASCDIIYKKLFGANTRFIDVDEFYAGTSFCRNEFYQGDLKEFRSNDPYFFNKITPFFKEAVNTDLTTNAYFGDKDRVTAATDTYSTNIIDGVFKWLKVYTASGVIPTAQTISIPDGKDYTATPADAYTLLKTMYERRPQLMREFLPDQQEFYVSPEIYEGYRQYLIATGTGNTGYINDIVTGRETPSYMGIPIRIQRFWTPVISALKGSAGYAAILTIRGNFVFGVDKSYGEGPDGNQAFELWYDIKDMTWYWRFFMRAGTAIGLPEYTVYALSSFT
jgi:hypothetical protein